jgi:ParB family chromosome partitioning protein
LTIDNANLSHQILSLPLGQIKVAPWNANQMDLPLLVKLKRSVRRFGLAGVLVVRPVTDDCYEVLSGNQRLQVLLDLGWESVPCVVLAVDDAEARLLAQTLNRLHGSDDLGLRDELLQSILRELPQEEVLSLLPETTASLQALGSLNQEDLASHLRNWQKARESRLSSFSVRLTHEQFSAVAAAVNHFLSRAAEAQHGGPNRRGTALYLLCQQFLDQENIS